MKCRCSKYLQGTVPFAGCLNLHLCSYCLQFFQTDIICKEAKYFSHWYTIVWVIHKRSFHTCNLPFVSRTYSAFHKNHTCYVNKVRKFHTPHFFLNYFPTAHMAACFDQFGKFMQSQPLNEGCCQSVIWTESPPNFHSCSVTYKYFLIIFQLDKLGGKKSEWRSQLHRKLQWF